MKTVQKFIANDGTEFVEQSKCEEYEALCFEIDELMSKLPSRPENDGCRFANGGGYIQHTPDVFWGVREGLLRIGNRLFPHKWFDQSITDRSVHPSWCGRLIDETNSYLSCAWYRLMCVDSELREWGQPYYANNSHGRTEVQISEQVSSNP